MERASPRGGGSARRYFGRQGDTGCEVLRVAAGREEGGFIFCLLPLGAPDFPSRSAPRRAAGGLPVKSPWSPRPSHPGAAAGGQLLLGLGRARGDGNDLPPPAALLLMALHRGGSASPPGWVNKQSTRGLSDVVLQGLGGDPKPLNPPPRSAHPCLGSLVGSSPRFSAGVSQPNLHARLEEPGTAGAAAAGRENPQAARWAGRKCMQMHSERKPAMLIALLVSTGNNICSL